MDAALNYPWWLVVLAAVGVLAIVTAILSLFFEIGGRPDKLRATEVPELRSADFLEAFAGIANAPLMEGGTARLLNNGDEVYPAMLDAIRDAQRTVNWMVYIWEPGEASDRVFTALVEAVRRGVEVRVMLDGMGGMRAPDDDIRRLREAGGQVCWFRPIKFGQLTRFHRRNHRRAIVMDGCVGFTGGVAVADKWLGDAGSREHWRDSMVCVRGCIAANLQSAFAELWTEITGEILVGPGFYPTSFEDALPGEEISKHVTITSSPSAEHYPLRKAFWLSFRAARERLYLTTPYFVPDASTRRVIADRARVGVDVRLLLPNEHTDAVPIRWAGQHYYDDLLEAGVRIWEYQPTMLHAKQVVIDGVWSLVGSANMDVRSKELNEEVVLGIMDCGFGREVEETFTRDLERAREIRLADWRGRGIGKRALERVCAMLEEQY